MSNEKPNDGFNWKDRLEELDSLPGETFSGKSESWEKLHLRLRSNKRRRKAAWYWIAAACLGLIVLLIPWNRNANKPPLVKVNTVTNKNKKPDVNASYIMKEDGNNVPDVSVKKRSVGTIAKKIHDAHSARVNSNGDTSTLSITVNSAEPMPELSANTLASIDTPLVNKTAVFVRKRLRVVHINELGIPMEEDAKEERYAERPSYYKRLINPNQDLFSNTSGNSHAFSNDLFKIKISPQN